MTDKYYVIKDRKGNLMVNSKVCRTRTGCKNSYNAMIDHEFSRLATYNGIYSNDFWTVKQLANEGYGLPRTVDDIPAFLAHVDNLNSNKGCGQPYKITKQIVADYNQVIKEVTANWQVEEIDVV